MRSVKQSTAAVFERKKVAIIKNVWTSTPEIHREARGLSCLEIQGSSEFPSLTKCAVVLGIRLMKLDTAFPSQEEN